MLDSELSSVFVKEQTNAKGQLLLNCIDFHFGKQQMRFPRLTLLKVLLEGKQRPSRATYFSLSDKILQRKAKQLIKASAY